jgi:hypothetical protein
MRRWIVPLIACLLPLILGGCPWNTVVREPVTVTRTVYVGVPKSLTKHCPDIAPRDPSVRESLRVNRARRACIASLHGQLDAIDQIQGTEVRP